MSDAQDTITRYAKGRTLLARNSDQSPNGSCAKIIVILGLLVGLESQRSGCGGSLGG